VSSTESHTFAYLGPVGTFTQAALKKLTCDSDITIPYANVTAVLDAVRSGEADYALVPIENSVEGVVARTLDELATGDPLVIAQEVTLPVTFALMVKPRKRLSESELILTQNHSAAHLLPRTIRMQRLFQ
jgi:prephenate dehydratase